MKVFFASRLQRPSASGRQRLGALQALGHDVVQFSLDGHEGAKTLLTRARNRIMQEPYEKQVMDRFGEQLVRELARTQPDLVWLEKPLMLLPEWLAEARRRAPQALFVCFQDDDPFGTRRAERMSWKHFLDCISLYDVHFVKREANLDEFAQHGANAFSCSCTAATLSSSFPGGIWVPHRATRSSSWALRLTTVCTPLPS